MSDFKGVIPAVRCQLRQAEEKLQISCKMLRENGAPDSANDLLRTLKMVRVWTQKDGFLDYLEKPNESSKS